MTSATVGSLEALPRSRPNAAGAPEVSTWSTRSEASMNDVDTDKRRRTLAAEEGPRTSYRHHRESDAHKIKLTRITHILTVMFAGPS
jgi:hypothetical protein